MKKYIIILDAVILLTVSCVFVVGLDFSFNLLKGKEKPDSPLILAANNRKNETELEDIIKENEHALTHRDTQLRTPLMRLCNSNLKDNDKRREVDKYISTIIPLAVKYNADLEAKDEHGWTALMWAAWSNLPTVTTMLIEAGADLNVTDIKGNTPLSVSLYKENSDVYSILNAPLVLAILTRQPEDTLLSLMEKQENLTNRDTLGRTPLMLISTVNVKEGEQLTEKDTYLAQATRLIVSKGAEVNAVDSNEKTALTYALTSNLPQVSKTLIELGSNVNHADKSGNTALICAAKNNQSSLIDSLLAAKADINARDKQGKTALYWAIENEHRLFAQELIAKGADISIVDEKGISPRDLAKEKDKANEQKKEKGEETFSSLFTPV